MSSHHNPNVVHLQVASVKKSMKFYTEKLGFELTECWPDERKPAWANVVLDRQSVMLGGAPDPEAAKKWGADKDEIARCKQDAKRFEKHPHGVGVQIYLVVPDVDALWKSAKKKRVPVLREPKTQFYGLRDFEVEDPDGYHLVFYTPVQAPAAAGAET